MTSDPPRLSLERGPDDPLGQALRAALSDVPSPQRVAEMERSLRRAIRSEHGASVAGRRGAFAFRGLRGARFTAAALAVTIAAGAATAFRLRTHAVPPPVLPIATTPAPQPPPARPRPASRVVPAISAEVPQDPAPPPQVVPPEPARSGRALDVASKGVEPPAESAPSSAELPPEEDETSAAPVRDPSSESALLGRAQRALGSNPGLALALAQTHAKDYPHGVLTQEREFIAVQALVALGRKAEATARADAFRRNYPGSAHLRRLDLLVAP